MKKHSIQNKNISLFLVLSLTTILLGLASNDLLNLKNMIINSLAEKLTVEQINEAISFKNRWEWLTYLVVPIFLLLKISIIALILDVGCFFLGKEIKYKKLFNIVVKAEFIFLLVIITKTAWFYFYKTNYTLEDLQYFYPLSALQIIGYEGLKSWFIYPLQVVNVFEVAYWILLSYFIGKEIDNNSSNKGFYIVASSYGVGLLIWVVGMMFFTLNMN